MPVVTGMPVASAKASSASALRDSVAPPPAMTTGRSAAWRRSISAVTDPVSPFRDVARSGNLVDPTLKRVEIAFAGRRRADDEDDRHAVEIGIGDRGVSVGEAGPGRQHRDADLARRAGIGLGGMA